MWIGVTPRFSQFDAAITPTTEQIADGTASVLGVVNSLNRNYRGSSDFDGSWFYARSWGKRTNRYPFNDADVFYVLPAEVYWRIEQTAGNKQSALLQEVKNVLSGTYPQTDMRGDGQVVQIRFNHLLVEIVPSFRLNDGRYLICDTNNGGSWKNADPVREIDYIDRADFHSNGNARRVIRMMKAWKEECNVPLKSYLIETALSDFMSIYEYRSMSYYWYDWILRDVFGHLASKANTWLTVPDGDVVFLGDAWVSRATTAYERSLKACDYEYDDQTILAGEEWRKIFGRKIPTYV